LWGESGHLQQPEPRRPPACRGWFRRALTVTPHPHQLRDFDKAFEYQEKANKLFTDAEDRKKGEGRLRLYKDKKPYRETDSSSLNPT
jgi:hypothetical protein